MVHQYILACKFHSHVDLHWIILIIGLWGIGPVIYAGHIPLGCPACPSEIDYSAYNITAEQSIENETQTITLYRSGQGLTWCQAHCACNHMDSSSYLLTIPNALKQQEIERFNTSDVSQQAWISANRISEGWYWVKDKFENCSQAACSDLDIHDGEYGTGRNDGIGPPVLRAQKIAENTISGRCQNGGISSSLLTWYDKQQWCMSQSSLLASWHGLLSQISPNLMYIGLQYRPWQWTQNGDTFPVLFTNWMPGDRQNAGVADCLSIELNSTSQGEWVELDCATTLHHFICESPDRSTEDTTPGSQYSSTPDCPECITTGCPGDPSNPLLPAVIVLAVLVAGLVAGLIGQHFYWQRREKSTELKTSMGNLEYEDTADTMAGLRDTHSRDVYDGSIGQVGPYELVTSSGDKAVNVDPKINGNVPYEHIILHNVTPTGNSTYTDLH